MKDEQWKCRCCGGKFPPEDMTLVIDAPYCFPCYRLLVVGIKDYLNPAV